jgi:hypothetical protein
MQCRRARVFHAKVLRRVGPFLKEFVKRKIVSLRVLRNGSAGRSGRLFLVMGVLADNGSQSIWIRLGCRRHGKLQSFFLTRDCSQHIPSRGTAHDKREQFCPVMTQADADLSTANSSP